MSSMLPLSVRVIVTVYTVLTSEGGGDGNGGSQSDLPAQHVSVKLVASLSSQSDQYVPLPHGAQSSRAVS